MQLRFAPDRASCFHILFGPKQAKELRHASWQELHAAANNEHHPLVAKWMEHDRARLFALLRLCALFYPNTVRPPEKLVAVGDVVRRFAARTPDLSMRTIWLVCVDASDSVTDEVLLQMGGSATRAPPLAGFLRQAILKEAASVWIVDYRPVEELVAHPGTVNALERLTLLADAIGICVRDWVLLGPNGVCAVREHVTLAEERGLAHQRKAA